MIILYEENEVLFQSLGLGLLKDAKSCLVSEGLNDNFELELQYPITGLNFSKITLNRIILCKSNPYSEAQPFRIYSISKPINGVITVRAFHISYDMNGIVVAPISGATPKLTIDQIQNKAISEHNFKFYTDITTSKSFKTTNYYNMRSLLMGSDQSILETYKGEILFDKFNVYILAKRGSNKGASVRYAKNMKDITHEVNYERLYNGVYPFYHQETTETTTTTTVDGFKKVYIVGSKPFQDGWLSYTPDGEPYHPVDESPVQIDTEGDYYEKVYAWNSTTQRYVEKIYNEMVNIIDCVTGMLGQSDKPSWIYIDVTGLPNIVVRANENGYFKLVSDTDWAYHNKGDVVFEGSITHATDGLIMYYAEVIPTENSVADEETTSITHVELDDKIMWLETDAAKAMKYNRVLCLDLTSEFEETPSKDELETKAKEYIEKNKIGQYKYDTKVSFIDLASTTEGAKYDKMETVELGDTVKVTYEDLGIDIELRVISTKYNVLLDRYEDINLGEKSEKLSASSVQTGDDVSSLTNDVGYADITTVNKLVAKMITADYIKAKNAELSKAQIEELQTARIKCTGIIEATQFELDTLVAKLLTADNAVIKQTLEAGTVKVKGDITVASGSISIQNTESGTVFNVDRDGNVTANSVHITGGELNINDTFTVTPEGILTAQGADIQGRIEALSGLIANFNIESDRTEGSTVSRIYSGRIGSIDSVLMSPGYEAEISSLVAGSKKWAFLSGVNFGVTTSGVLYAKEANISGSMHITAGSIEIKDRYGTTNFLVTDQGYMTANNVTITGGSITIQNEQQTVSFIANSDGTLQATGLTILNGSIQIGQTTISSQTVYNFEVTSAGALTARNATILGGSILLKDSNNNTIFSASSSGVEINAGSISISDSDHNVNFEVTDEGILTAVDVNLTGEINAERGTIGGFTIGDTAIYKDIESFDEDYISEGVYLGIDGLRIGKNLKIYADGRIMSSPRTYSEDLEYSVGDTCFHFNSMYRCISDTTGTWDDSKWEEISVQSFGVDNNGKLVASSAEIIGFIQAESGYIGIPGQGFMITSKAIYSGFDTAEGQATSDGVYLGTDGIRLGRNVSATKTVSYGTLSNGTESSAGVTKSIDDANTNYIGSEFILTYDPVDFDRLIVVREKENASSGDSDLDDYIHTDYPTFDPFQATTKNGEYNFELTDSDWVYINLDDARFYSSGIFQGISVGVRLYYDQIGSTTYVKIQKFSSYEDWVSETNPQDMSLLSSITLSNNVKSVDLATYITHADTPWIRLKITSSISGQITSISNCYITQNTPKQVLLPANSSQISITPQLYKNIKITYISAPGIVSPGSITNTTLSLKVLPGFLVTPDGMMTCYNASVKGSFIGDVNITSGSISIKDSNNVEQFKVTNQGDVTIKSGSITIGSTFSVTSAGALTASNVNLTGEINASSGTIGGFTITSNLLYKGSETMLTTGSFILAPDGKTVSVIDAATGGTTTKTILMGISNGFLLDSDGNPYFGQLNLVGENGHFTVRKKRGGGGQLDHQMAFECVINASSWNGDINDKSSLIISYKGTNYDGTTKHNSEVKAGIIQAADRMIIGNNVDSSVTDGTRSITFYGKHLEFYDPAINDVRSYQYTRFMTAVKRSGSDYSVLDSVILITDSFSLSSTTDRYYSDVCSKVIGAVAVGNSGNYDVDIEAIDEDACKVSYHNHASGTATVRAIIIGITRKKGY